MYCDKLVPCQLPGVEPGPYSVTYIRMIIMLYIIKRIFTVKIVPYILADSPKKIVIDTHERIIAEIM